MILSGDTYYINALNVDSVRPNYSIHDATIATTVAAIAAVANRVAGVQRVAPRLLSWISAYETTNIKVVQSIKLGLKEGDARRQCRVLTPIGPVRRDY